MSRVLRGLRRTARALPPLALVLAIAAYAAFLATAHAASTHGRVRQGDTQQLADAAFDRTNTLRDAGNGALELGRSWKRPTSARWRIGPSADPLPAGAQILRARVFFTGIGFSMYRRGSFTTISVDGRPVATLRPDVNGPHLSTFAVLDPPIDLLDVAPKPERALEFDLPPEGACVRTACTLDVRGDGILWVIGRVGVVYETQQPAPPLWLPWPGWKIVGVALLLAAFSHVVLSIRATRFALANDTRRIAVKP